MELFKLLINKTISQIWHIYREKKMSNINVNNQYNYSIDILGNMSGGTAPAGAVAPHPEDYNFTKSSTGNTVTDLSAIKLGGVNGLNN